MTWGQRIDELSAALETAAVALDRAGTQMDAFGFARSALEAHDAARAARHVWRNDPLPAGLLESTETPDASA